MTHWQEYIRSSYELILDAEGKTATYLNEPLEYYLVNLMAKWFDKPNIPPDTPVAILMLTAMQNPRKENLSEVADICLFYDSFKIKQPKWPSPKYYKDMGATAYGMAYVASNDNIYNQLEISFDTCSRILSKISISS
jgi:hypothetical protein